MKKKPTPTKPKRAAKKKAGGSCPVATCSPIPAPKLWTGWDSVRRLVRNILSSPQQKKKWLELSARIRELREQRDIASRNGEYALSRKFSDDMTAAQLERDAVYFPNVERRNASQ